MMRQPGRAATFGIAGLILCVSKAAAAAPGALGGSLSQMVARWESGDPDLTLLLSLHLTNRSGDPVVKLHVADGVALDTVLPELSAMGFRLTATSSIDPRFAEGYLPLGSARAAASVPGVQNVRAQLRPHASAGSVRSQAVALLKARVVQKRGIDGTGVRVGALSDSYDACPPPDPKRPDDIACEIHAADDVKTRDLPPDVTVLKEITSENGPGTDEGRAMLQLVHEVAPGAKLGFASAFNGELQFAENILALRSQFHADVIVDDVIYFDEPMFSDGIVAQAADAVNKDGAAYFSSAMNNGMEAYEADYRPVPFAEAQALVAAGRENVKLDQIPARLRPKSFHNFGHGLSPTIAQLITTAGDNIIDFQWDEPFFLGKVRTDYNIYVFDAAGNFMDPDHGKTVFYTHDDNTAANVDAAIELAAIVPHPKEIHGGANASDYQLLIGKMNDGPARHIKHVVINGLAPFVGEGASSIWGHAAARGAQGVAAAFYSTPHFPEDFSSPGPATIFFDRNGDRLEEPEVRFTPQVTAADGVDTTFFPPGPLSLTDPDGTGAPNFFGTSAAAADAAAVAALVIQAAGGRGRIHPDKVYRTLQRTATPISLPNDRSWAAAFAGPVAFSANGDWTRWNRYFGLAVQPFASRTIKSVVFDTSRIGLTWSGMVNRFHVGPATGITARDISFTRTATTLTLTFKAGTFGAGDAFKFGMSVFHPLQASTREDPDRFRGMTVAVTLDNGSTFTGTVFAAPPERINRFTGFGLVNADAAVRSVQRGHDDD